MSIMTPEVQWEVIVLSMQKAKWESQEALSDAVSDIRTAWTHGEDRELLMRAATNFGQVSGFTGKVMTTVDDAILHEKKLLGKPVAEPIVKVEAIEIEPPAEVPATPQQEALSTLWREAVAGRKAMLGAAKDEMNAQIKVLRDNYAELERQWDDYVAATREAARKSK